MTVIEITEEMVQINKLHGFHDVKDIYYMKGYDVYNVVSGHKKKITKSQRYPYVTLERKNKKIPKKCLMHHLVALSYIGNNKFEVIEHLNDNPDDFRIENLMFSSQKENVKRAFTNGHPNRKERLFRVELYTGKKYTGTMRHLSRLLNVPRQTLYCIFYEKRHGKNIMSVTEARSTDYPKGIGREKYSVLSAD